MPVVKALEDRGRTLTDALLTHDVLAYRGATDTGALLDTLVALHEELNERQFLSSPNINEFVERYKGSVEDVKRLRLGKRDFEFVRSLARGQFGIVDIVRSKHNKGVYAMKTLNKQALLSQREQAAFLEERDVLVLGKDSPWIPDLYAAFQDKENLYIVMEFVAGGDLFSMLDRCENAIIDESAARFYAAELVLALEDLHKIGYIHRDCKPQNTLLDERGHVKLADFGSCARIDASGAHEAQTSVPVGTCDYIAPEILRARELGNGGVVSTSCDWWSLGTVLYEMIYGDPPFYSDSVPETYGKIMSSEKHLSFDPSLEVSEEAKDLMRKLLVRQEDRLGLPGIKAHAFFASVDWDRIRQQDAPFVPRISSPDDTSNFSVGDEAEEDMGMAMARASSSRLGHGREYAGEQLPFIGFTFLPQTFTLSAKRLAPPTPRGPRDDPTQLRGLKLRVEQLEAENARLKGMQAEWEEERRLVKTKVAALEAKALLPPPVTPAPIPVPKRDSAIQTDDEEKKEKNDDADKDAYARLAESLAAQFSGQSEHLTKLVAAVNGLAEVTGDKLDEGLQMQRKEISALASLIQPSAPTLPRLSSKASMTQVYQASGSSARLSVGQTTRAPRRSISANDDSLADTHPTVVATLVNETRSATDASRQPGSPAVNRVSRAERRVSAGVASDALSVIGNKCDRLAALFEQYASEIEGIHQSQASLMAICSALKSAVEPGRSLADIPEVATPEGSTRSRRKTEQIRRRGAPDFTQPAATPADSAVDLYRAATDELVAGLRAQLSQAEDARVAAEARAAELLGWIGRESKGRALLEDMIRTAQQACKMAEDKFEQMSKETDSLKRALGSKDESISSLQATVETRDKELRHLRRASRKALDQLADISAQPQPPLPTAEKTKENMDVELQEAVTVHVRLQFEIARLEGEVSRLESEKAQLAKELKLKDSKLRAAESLAESDGIRVRPMDGGIEDDEGDSKYGSTGAKSHKRFKIQLQNLQSHVEYLETKLVLAVSENEQLKKQQSPGIKFPSFSRKNSNNLQQQQQQQPDMAEPRLRPTSMFPNLHSNMGAAFASAASFDGDRKSTESADSYGTAGNSYSPTSRPRPPLDPSNGSIGSTGSRPRNDSTTSSFERIRSPFKGFRKHFS